MINTPYTENILKVWNSATAQDLAAGKEWYERASEAAEALAAGTPAISYHQAAGIIAALSPRVQWKVNLRWASQIVDAIANDADCPAVSFTANREKAWRIANGEDPLIALSGPKVRAFYANITGDRDAVTVDVWAARIAEGEAWKPEGPKGKRYDRLAAAYREAADIAGVDARDMQAATWVHTRGRAD